MKMILRTLFAAIVVMNLGNLLSAEDKKPESSSPALPPEIDVLKKWVGKWEATIESTGAMGNQSRVRQSRR